MAWQRTRAQPPLFQYQALVPPILSWCQCHNLNTRWTGTQTENWGSPHWFRAIFVKITPVHRHKSAPSNRWFIVLPDEGSRANFLHVAFLTKKKRDMSFQLRQTLQLGSWSVAVWEVSEALTQHWQGVEKGRWSNENREHRHTCQFYYRVPLS